MEGEKQNLGVRYYVIELKIHIVSSWFSKADSFQMIHLLRRFLFLQPLNNQFPVIFELREVGCVVTIIQ